MEISNITSYNIYSVSLCPKNIIYNYNFKQYLNLILLYIIMLNNSDIKFIEYILSYINFNEKFIKLFKHHKQIYPIKDLFSALIIKLKTGIPYNHFSFLKINIKGGNLYYFHKKLIKYKFFELFFEYYIGTYIENMHEFEKEFYVDSTLIANKLGIDLTSYNIQLKKHKSTKVSLIIDDFGVPIDFITTNSNCHDASICIEHINNIANNFPQLCTNDKFFIADAAYDSSNIRDALIKNKIGKLICDKNKRNTKDPNKLKKYQLNLHTKMLLKKRSKVEHTNNILKKNKTINVRYEKYSVNYNSFVLIAIMKLAFNKIGIIEKYIM